MLRITHNISIKDFYKWSHTFVISIDFLILRRFMIKEERFNY